MHEIQDVVSIAAHGTMGCVEDTVAWVTGGVQKANEGQSFVERALRVASLGLDAAMVMAEALMDHMIPATEEDKGAWRNAEILMLNSWKSHSKCIMILSSC